MRRLVVGGGFAGVWSALAAALLVRRSGGELDIAVVAPNEDLVRPRPTRQTRTGCGCRCVTCSRRTASGTGRAVFTTGWDRRVQLVGQEAKR